MRRSHCPVRMPGTAFRDVAEEGGLVVVPSRGEVNVLNPLGSFVFGLLDGSRSIEDLRDAVASEYDVSSEQALLDVRSFLEDLDGRGMLAWEDSPRETAE